MRITFFILVVFVTAALIGGCGTSKSELPVWQSNKRLLEKNNELESKISALESENKQLKQQAQTLENLGTDVRLENLYDIQSIQVNSATGIYTKQKGEKPQLIVYFSPIDETGDSVKAAGSLEVELWNIAAKENQSLIHKWEIGPAKLKKDWGSAFIGSFYRVALDLPENMPSNGDFIVRLSFTDYLRGKVLTARRSINKPEL